MFWKILDLYCRNIKEITTMGMIMVSALIVFIGCLKPFVFDKIHNKDVRGVLLSLSNLIGAYGTVAVAFLFKKINFDYYWFTATVFCVFSVFVYWFYENTKLRAGIHKLGKFVLTKLGKIITTKLDNLASSSHEIAKIVDELTEKSGKKTEKKSKAINNDTKNL